MPRTITSSSPNDTIVLAKEIAKNSKPGDLYCLYGDLGIGKSVFCRAFIQYLAAYPINVPSPTFTLVQTYETNHGVIWHYDLYRIQEPQEIYALDWEDALIDGIILMEWPERIKYLMPPKRTDIIFESDSDQKRIITIDQKE